MAPARETASSTAPGGMPVRVAPRLLEITTVPAATQQNAMNASAKWTMPLPPTGCPSMSSAKNASSPEQTAQFLRAADFRQEYRLALGVRGCPKPLLLTKKNPWALAAPGGCGG